MMVPKLTVMKTGVDLTIICQQVDGLRMAKLLK